MRRVVRHVYHVGMILLFVLVALAGFTQTIAFKATVLERVLSDVREEIEGTVSVDALEGNLLTGFRLTNVRGFIDSTTMVAVPRLDVTYDMVGLLLGSVRLSNVTVTDASLTIIRGLDGRWNFEKFIPAPSQDTAAATATVYLRNVRFDNARVRMIDSVALMDGSRGTLPASVFDPSNLTLDHVTLLTDVVVSPAGVKIDLDQLSAVMPKHGLTIAKASGAVEIGKRRTSVRSFSIETDRSTLSINGVLGSGLGSVSTLRDLRGKSIELRLQSSRLDLRELRQYIYPDLEFLDNRVALDLEVSGTVDRLNIKQLLVRTPRSAVHVRGLLTHLDTPENLRLDIEGDESILNSEDIRSVLPGLDIPSWDKFGTLKAFSSFAGTLRGFDARLTLASERGSVDVTAHIESGANLTFKGTAQTTDVDLGGFLGDGTELTRLNGRVEFDGSGTVLDSLFAVVKSEFDTSTVVGIRFEHAVLVVDAARGSIRSHLSAASDAGSVNLSGQLLVRRGELRSYSGQGEVTGLDLSRIPGLSPFDSELNAGVSFIGRRTSLQESDSVRVQFYPSRFGKYQVPPVVAAVQYDRLSSAQSLRISSPQVNAAVDGRFDLAGLYATVERSVQLVSRHIGSTFGSLDSLRGEHAVPFASIPFSYAFTADEPSDVRLRFNMTTIEPLSAMLFLPFEGQAQGEFHVVDRPDQFALEGIVTSDMFVVEDSSVSVDARSLTMSIDSRTQLVGVEGAEVASTLRMSSPAMSVNGLLFSGSNALVTLTDSSGITRVQTLIDSTVSLDGVASLSFANGFGTMRFDSLTVAAHTYEAVSDGPAQVRFGRDGFVFDRLSLASGFELFEARGFLDPTGISDLTVQTRGFLASRLREILKRSSASGVVQRLEGIVDAEGHLKGSFDHPNLEMNVRASGVAMDGIPFGSIRLDGSYFENLLTVDMRVDRTVDTTLQRTPDLLVRGTVPYSIALVGEPEDSLEGEIDLVIVSPGLDLKFFEPFLAGVTRSMQGTLLADVHMRGDVHNPRYEGKATIANGQFLFEPTRIEYLIDGDLLPLGDRVRLQNVVIRNLPYDLSGGRMVASGYLRLEGLSIAEFDLGFSGLLRVLKEDSSRTPDAKYYGDLTVATGGQGLSWRGTPDQSLLSGVVGIRNANITLPPDREVVQHSARLIDVMHSLKVDTTGGGTKPGSKELIVTRPPEDERSFVDRINFDLVLQTEGTTQVRFVFDRQSSDILFADLRGRLTFQRTGSWTRLSGEVDVTDRSYYNFLKRFSASGKMFFTGDPLNPELDIVATYTGMHQGVTNGSTDQANSGTSEKSKEEPTTVTLYLTGPRSNLETRFEVTVVRETGPKKLTGDVEADAIAFIMTNRFRDELTEQQQAGMLGGNLGFGLASGYLTGPLSEALRRTTRGGVQSIDVIYYGNTGESTTGTDLRVSGQVGDAIYRIGGRVLDDLSSTNVVIELPMSWILNAPDLRNLILTLEKRGQGRENIEDPFRAEHEARLKYRISF